MVDIRGHDKRFYITDVKTDLSFLKDEITNLNSKLTDILSQITRQTDRHIDRQTHQHQISTHIPLNQTHQHQISTHNYISTDNLPFKALKQPISKSSIGNQGVSTDRQTHRQTDRHIIKRTKTPQFQDSSTLNQLPQKTLNNASEILESLDNLKKDLRLKFKRLTPQEMLIFSLIYQLEEQGNTVDYALLSSHKNLSQSSVRDHVNKLISKGIPVVKEKINNKKIILNISPDLKKIASLSTIVRLREL